MIFVVNEDYPKPVLKSSEINKIVESKQFSKTFHYASLLKWLFFILGVYYTYSNGIIRSEDYLTRISMGITLIGIGYAIGSLSDIESISKKERKIISDLKKFKKATTSIFCNDLH